MNAARLALVGGALLGGYVLWNRETSQRAQNYWAGLGWRTDDETPLYYIRRLATERLRLSEAQADAISDRIRGARMTEQQIRDLSDRFAEAVRALPESPTPADVKGALDRLGIFNEGGRPR